MTDRQQRPLKRPEKGMAQLPSWFMKHTPHHTLYLESEQQQHLRPMKSTAFLPQWWLHVTPHDTLERAREQVEEDGESSLSVQSQERTYAEIYVERANPMVSPLTHTLSWTSSDHDDNDDDDDTSARNSQDLDSIYNVWIDDEKNRVQRHPVKGNNKDGDNDEASDTQSTTHDDDAAGWDLLGDPLLKSHVEI